MIKLEIEIPGAKPEDFQAIHELIATGIREDLKRNCHITYTIVDNK